MAGLLGWAGLGWLGWAGRPRGNQIVFLASVCTGREGGEGRASGGRRLVSPPGLSALKVHVSHIGAGRLRLLGPGSRTDSRIHSRAGAHLGFTPPSGTGLTGVGRSSPFLPSHLLSHPWDGLCWGLRRAHRGPSSVPVIVRVQQAPSRW